MEILGSAIKELNSDWCELHIRGIEVKRNPDYQEWTDFILPWKVIKESMPFIVGDWVNLGEGTFSEKFSQALEIFGDHEYQTVMNWASVCRRVPFGIRNELTFSHHSAVAYLKTDAGKPDHQAMRYFLSVALDQDMTVRKLKEFIKDRREDTEQESAPMSSEKFHNKIEKVCGDLSGLAEQVQVPEIKHELLSTVSHIRTLQYKYDKLIVSPIEHEKAVKGDWNLVPATD